MSGGLELLRPDRLPRRPIRAAVFDFDGTVSTLRCGWEEVMGPMMLEYLSPDAAPDPALIEEVRRYIDDSTGIQTVFQMQWLADRVCERGGEKRDAWWYKAEYNRRLTERIRHKKQAIADGLADPEQYRIADSIELLTALKEGQTMPTCCARRSWWARRPFST